MQKVKKIKSQYVKQSNAKGNIAFKSKTQKVKGKKSHHQNVKRTKSQMEERQNGLKSNVKSQYSFKTKWKKVKNTKNQNRKKLKTQKVA